MDDAKFKALLSTADLFKNFARKAVATDRGLQAETLIIATARMAGALMYRSFGLGATLSPGTVVLTEKANIDGPKLMNLMIVTLQHLGHKDFFESSIDAKYQFKDLIQIDFEATQKRLGSFFQLCIQSAGLSYFDAALAAAIATAINIHDCREVLDIRKGAKCCIDLEHWDSKIRRYRFLNYAWMTYDVGSEGRKVNSYFLPEQYWKPFVTHADRTTQKPTTATTAFKNERIPEKDRLRISSIVNYEKISAISSAVHRFHIPSYWTTNPALGVCLIKLGGGGSPDDIHRMPYCALVIGDEVVVFNVVSKSTGSNDVGVRALEEVRNLFIPPNLRSREPAIKQLICDGLKESANLDPSAVGLAVLNPTTANRVSVVTTDVEFK